jgi:hypothetical protein
MVEDGKGMDKGEMDAWNRKRSAPLTNKEEGSLRRGDDRSRNA